MIPDDMLAEAVRIYNENVGFEYASPLALEAVLLAFLPRAWGEGYTEGSDDEWQWERGRNVDAALNPYRKEQE